MCHMCTPFILENNDIFEEAMEDNDNKNGIKFKKIYKIGVIEEKEWDKYVTEAMLYLCTATKTKNQGLKVTSKKTYLIK